MDLSSEKRDGRASSTSSRPKREGAPLDAIELEFELTEARARIESLETALDDQARSSAELLQWVSHELRTPITVIRGFGRLLEDETRGELNRDQRVFVAEALKACRRLDRFVEDLLSTCPKSDTAMALAFEHADLHVAILSQVAALEPLYQERGVTVELDLAATAPLLSFDQDRVEQVLANLMSNALHYGGSGGRVRLSTRNQAEPLPGSIVVSVEDEGPGIPPADRERVFDAYFRGDVGFAAIRERAGLGVGLAICRRIVDAHKGTIRAVDGALGGACIEVTLPGPTRSHEEA